MDIRFIKGKPLNDPNGHYNGFHPSTTVLPKGYVAKEGHLPLPCSLIWDRDVAVTLRDGVTIYTDIFRPMTDEKLPVIIGWSPYGKSNLDQPWAYNEPAQSHLQKEEAVDPALWCAHGYAVANPDARGAYMSEGNMHFWSTQEGEDIYDFIEWLAAQDWCSGRIGMAGNSYLAISQWNAAGLKPPHLTAIAPWEGMSDVYRDSVMRGGIPNLQKTRHVAEIRCSNNYVESVADTAMERPLMDEYWQDKRMKLENIAIPAYIVASYTNPLHTGGTFRGFREIGSADKWLRIHNSQEWCDLYRPESQADLLRFYDRYLKGADNGWEDTPPVRYCLLNPGHEDVVDIPASSFPPEGVSYAEFHLDTQNGKLSEEKSAQDWPKSYPAADAASGLRFVLPFSERTDVIGYPKVKLWLEAEDADDMDVYVRIGKLDDRGEPVLWQHKPPIRYMGDFAGCDGMLRVSLRALDDQRSTEEIPVQSFARSEKMGLGEIVAAEIPIWPIGMRFEAGESLALYIMPCDTARSSALPPVNRGRHILHSGGSFDSVLRLPIRADK